VAVEGGSAAGVGALRAKRNSAIAATAVRLYGEGDSREKCARSYWPSWSRTGPGRPSHGVSLPAAGGDHTTGLPRFIESATGRGCREIRLS